jgi:hypothetical protein
MSMDFQQTDDAAACAAAARCSGAGVNGDTDFNKAATVGGSAGVSEVTVTVDVSAADLACAWVECIVPAGATWGAGNWTVRLNVATGNHQITLDAIYICRVNSSCTSQATIGSLTAINANLASAGVQTHTVSGSAQSPSAGDKVIIIFLFDNAQAMTQDIGLTPDQIITAAGFEASVPASLVAVPAGRRFAHMMRR